MEFFNVHGETLRTSVNENIESSTGQVVLSESALSTFYMSAPGNKMAAHVYCNEVVKDKKISIANYGDHYTEN